jgi:hypothetical protein
LDDAGVDPDRQRRSDEHGEECEHRELHQRDLGRVDVALQVAAEEDHQHDEGRDRAELPLREVEHPRRPVDERDTERHERVDGTEREPVHQDRPEGDAGGAERADDDEASDDADDRTTVRGELTADGLQPVEGPARAARAAGAVAASAEHRREARAARGVAASGLLGCCLLRHRPTSRVDVLTGVRLPRSST